MREATFVRKRHGRGYDANMVYLDYEYRGHEYTVYENRAEGNEPLSWQHRSEQNRIDRLVEHESAEPGEPCRCEDSADYAIHEFLKYCDGEPSDFD